MASQLAILAVAVLVALPLVASATQWTVRDDSGWTFNFDYDAWAKGKPFRIKDTFLFKYPKGNHNVFKVNGSIFQACKIPTNEAFGTGSDIIPRDSRAQVVHLRRRASATPAKNSEACTAVPSGFKILAATAVALVLLVI